MATLIAAHDASGAAVCCSFRQIVFPDGEVLAHDEPEDVSRRHVDTNCMFFTKSAAFLASLWAMMPRAATAIGDRIIFSAMQYHKLKIAWSNRKTVHYVTRFANHYRMAGRLPPGDAHDQSVQAALAEVSKDEFLARTRLPFALTPTHGGPAGKTRWVAGRSGCTVSQPAS